MDHLNTYQKLLIIFVFDPLAIAMVIAANFAFAQIPKEEKEVPSPHYSPQPIIPREVIMEELSKTEISKELGKNDKEPKEELYTEEDEKRMDVIGQNGNDGIHYEKIETVEEKIETKPGHVIKQELKLEKQRKDLEEVKQREQEKLNKNILSLSTGKKVLTYKSNRDGNR